MRKGILWRWYHVDVFWYLLCGVGIEKIEYIYIYIYTFKRLVSLKGCIHKTFHHSSYFLLLVVHNNGLCMTPLSHGL